MPNNKKQGNNFEREFMQILHQNGFWCHKLIENENGAPFDIIAIKNYEAFAFECKNIENGTRFPFKRVEENQKTALERLCLETWVYFVFHTPQGIFLTEGNDVMHRLKSNEKTFDVSDLKTNFSMDEWFNAYGN